MSNTYATPLLCGCWIVEGGLVRAVGCVRHDENAKPEPDARPAHPATMIGRRNV